VGDGDERPRFLHSNPVRNYTDVPALAARGEPEAVSASEQAELTAQAHRRWQREAQREWGRARAQILDATAHVRDAGVGDRQVIGSLRAIERSVAAVDQAHRAVASSR
jgi:hypothetical protein